MIAKLFSNRDTDRQDIIKDTVLNALDWDLLDQIARSDEEVKLNALNDRNYKDFLFNYPMLPSATERPTCTSSSSVHWIGTPFISRNDSIT